jgi:DNA-directed RNA polymerase beta' subunit
MEFETYEEVIDSYNSGVGVEGGESLTDYIKRNNIKIKEISMDPMGDFEKILKGSKPMEKEGIESIQLASGNKNMDINIETVVKEFIRRKKRKPNSIEEIKEFYFKEMGSAGTGASNKDNVQLASYSPGDYDPAMVEAYEQYKYDMEEQKPGFPIMEIDEFIRMERSNIATGGLAGILGV